MDIQRCPICGGECFEKVTKSNGVLGPGFCVVTQYYVCTGCSVMFKDPAKFLREQDDYRKTISREYGP